MNKPLEGELQHEEPSIVATREHWYKIAGLMLAVEGKTEFEVKTEDLAKLDGKIIVMDTRNNKLIVRLLPEAEGLKLVGMSRA